MQIYRKSFWLIILLLSLFVNCSKNKAAKMAWEDIKRINQYNIYRQFLMENPETEYREDIEHNIDSLKPNWHPEMRDVKSMSVVFEEDLPEGINFYQSRDQIRQALRQIVEDMGFEFDELNQPVDAKIKVQIEGTADAKHYQISRGGLRTGRHYSGARISGNILLTKENQSLLSKKFYGNIPAPDHIGIEYNTPSDAPFNRAFLHSNFPSAGYALFTDLLNMPIQIDYHHHNELLYQFIEKRFLNTAKGNERLNIDQNRKQKLIPKDTYQSYSGLKNENIYFNLHDNYLFVRDRESGKLLWKFKAKDNIRMDPLITDDHIYICTNQCLYAIHPEDGSLNWKFNTLSKNDRLTLEPVILNNTIYVGHYRLYAVDTESGILKWKFWPNIIHSRLDLQLSTDGTDTLLCVMTDFSTSYLQDRVNK